MPALVPESVLQNLNERGELPEGFESWEELNGALGRLALVQNSR